MKPGAQSAASASSQYVAITDEKYHSFFSSSLATLSISAHSSGEAGSVTGYPLTTEVTIDAFLGYASRRYRIPEDFAGDWRMLVLPPAPPSKRGGVIFPIENSQWLVTLGAYARDYPPTDDEAAFMAFAKDLRSPLLHQAIQNAEPLSEIRGWEQTATCGGGSSGSAGGRRGSSRSGTRCGPSTRSTGKV